MVDTIVVQLHDLKKHQSILNSLRILKTGFRKIDLNGVLLPETGGTLQRELIINDENDREKEKFLYKVRHQASSHYKIIFTADKYKDCLTFNFSIPKYFYGHNIAQSIFNVNEVDGVVNIVSFDDHLEAGFTRVIRYLRTFFDYEFPSCEIDWTCLELKRLDFCFNQIFRTKNESLQYLDIQRDVRKKHLRQGSTKSNNYDTSIFFSNKDYSVKIYHKGTEYAKNDAKEHERINEVKRRNVFNIGYLQQFSDKILRYEITIRPSYMSYLFNQNIFRAKSTQYQMWKKIYNQIRNIEKRLSDGITYGEDIEKNLFEVIYERYKNKIDKQTGLTIFEYFRAYYTKNYKKQKPITLNETIRFLKKFRHEFETLDNYRRRFFFDLSEIDRYIYFDDNSSNDNKFNTFKNCYFSKELYKLMGGKLLEFIKDMRVEEKKPTNVYIEKIHEYNKSIDEKKKFAKDLPQFLKERVPPKIEVAKLGLVLYALENSTLDEIASKLGQSRMTVHRWKYQLKLIGYTKHTIGKFMVDVPDIDFRRYYDECTFNQDKIFINRHFTLLSSNFKQKKYNIKY